MPRRAHRDQPLVVDDDRHQAGVRVGAVPESHGRVAAQHQRADFLAQRGLQPQVQARVLLGQAAQPRGQAAAGEGADQRQRHRAVRQAAHGADRRDSVPHGGQQRLRVRQEGAAGLGEGRSAAEPVKQRRAELGLQQLDAAAGRGLGQVQGGRAAAEAAAAGDREERLNLIELHKA
jgi:hypothetical protein